MEALLAIAMLCQVSCDGLWCSTSKAQLKCQQEYIKCYEEKLEIIPSPDNQDPKVWFGRLKDCVKERKVR